MDKDQADKHIDESCSALVRHGRLLLTVDVRSNEEAEELMRWMYAKNKPMKAELLEIAWNKRTVDAAVADAIEVLRKSLVA